jgi:hypothetical protein
MPAIAGIDCKVYVNVSTLATAALRRATPTWSEWQCVRDSTLALDFNEVDSTCRGSGGYATVSPTTTNLEVTGNAVKDKDDATYIVMELAAVNKTIVDVLVLDGNRANADTDGWRLDGQIMSWSEGQPYQDILTVDFTLKPARSPNPPAMVSGPL